MSRKENLSQSTHTANSWRPPRRSSQPSSTRSRRSTSSTAKRLLLFLQRKNSCLRRCCQRKARTTLPGQARRLRNSPPPMASLLRVLVLVRTASGLSLMLRRPWPNLLRTRCWCLPTHSILQTRRDSPLSARRVRARTVASSSRTSSPGLTMRTTRKTSTSLLALQEAHDAGIKDEDIATLHGSGKDGRILLEDIKKYITESEKSEDEEDED